MLSAKSATVLEAIACGCTYEQIISSHPGFTYLDIFSAAKEALGMSRELSHRTTIEGATLTEKKSISDIRKENRRAYEKWTRDEEDRLIAFADAGCPIPFIAKSLRRQPGAIRSRLEKLGISSN